MNAGNLLGGIETSLLVLARSPVRLVHEHAVSFEGAFSERLRGCGARVHVLGPVRVRRPITVWRARCRLRRLLREGDHRLVVAHGAWPYGLASRPARACRRGLVWFAHGPPVRSLLERWALRVVPDLVLANSEFTAREVGRVLPGVPVTTVRPLVAPPVSLEASARRALRASLGASDQDIVVVMVGRLEPCKGHRVLVEALTRLPRELGWKAWIVGGAQSARELSLERWLTEAIAQGSLGDRLRLLGQRADIAELLAAADLYCQPNVGPDSFGLTFVEALQAGLPVVTSALGGALEVVDASCGLLLPPGDSATLSACLEDLIRGEDRRRALGAAGPARARLLCDATREVARLETALEELERGGKP